MSIGRELRAALAASLVLAAPAAAHEYEILHAFQASPANAKAPMLLAADGALYGVFETGGRGAAGGIFVARPQPDGRVAVTTMYEFERQDGGGVLDALIEGPDGWLFGVAPRYGASGHGTIFRFNRVTGVFSVLHHFAGSDGARPRGPLVAATDGNYYGTATLSGPNGRGTIFRLTPAGVVSTLHAFSDRSASGLLIQADDGHLYGTAGDQIFRLTLDGTLTILHTLAPQIPLNIPPIPSGLVQGLDGKIYGVLVNQPLGNHFFSMSLDGAFTIIYSSPFFQIGDGQATPNTPLFVAADGSLLGTLPFGAQDRGTVFRLTTTGTFTVLHTFSTAEGRSYSGIVRHTNGYFYGTTVEGGFNGLGSIYTIGSGGAIDVRHTFASLSPFVPSAAPVDGPDGTLYGTTIGGGVFNRGTVYRLSASGITVLHHFFGLDGAYPTGRLLLGADGLFYGTTSSGGAQNRGTIFRMSASGAFQTLFSFTTLTGRSPAAGLVLGSDGNYWGTTLYGGSTDSGTIFKISPAGTFTQVHTFVFNPSADMTMTHPYAELIRSQDGKFLGTTYGEPGTMGAAVFRLTPAGEVTRLYQFQFGGGVEGPKMLSPLVEGDDGLIYGVACCGGSLAGTPPQVFQLTPGGVLTTLQVLAFGSALASGNDQAFYGATADGVLFRVESRGSFAELKTLTEEEGLFPSSLRPAGDGIIGSAYGGGPHGGGVIFRFKRE